MPLLQDGPPPGGFAPVRYARRIPSKGPSAVAIFLTAFGAFSWGMYEVGKGNEIRSFGGMETSESKSNSETKGKVVQIFPHFMARVAKFEELAAAGNQFLVNFRQGLEFIRRPSIDNTSEIFEKVIKANNTDRIQSYVKAGYVHTSSRAENLNKSKDIITELECLVEDIRLAIEAAASEASQDYDTDLDLEASTCSEEKNVSFVPKKPGDVDYATMVSVVYSMVKQDYTMQEKIVSSLSLKTSSGELESYCLMWSLHPFVNDEIMHQAWSLIS